MDSGRPCCRAAAMLQGPVAGEIWVGPLAWVAAWPSSLSEGWRARWHDVDCFWVERGVVVAASWLGATGLSLAGPTSVGSS